MDLEKLATLLALASALDRHSHSHSHCQFQQTTHWHWSLKLFGLTAWGWLVQAVVETVCRNVY